MLKYSRKLLVKIWFLWFSAYWSVMNGMLVSRYSLRRKKQWCCYIIIVCWDDRGLWPEGNECEFHTNKGIYLPAMIRSIGRNDRMSDFMSKELCSVLWKPYHLLQFRQGSSSYKLTSVWNLRFIQSPLLGDYLLTEGSVFGYWSQLLWAYGY